MAISALGYLVFEVSEVEPWAKFGKEVLGLAGSKLAKGCYQFRMDEQEWRIEIVEGPSNDLKVLGFEVAGKEQLELTRRRLIHLGHQVELASEDDCRRRRVSRMLRCEDPDGLLVEIYYGAALIPEKPFVSPTGAQFITGAQGVGHVLLTSANVEEMRSFYLDGLGLTHSDVIDVSSEHGKLQFSIDFLHCNSRHHSVALTSRYRPKVKRMGHFMLEMATLDEVGFALERAMAAEVTISRSLGRHTNDQMVSFYAVTPAGFDVEVGWGAIEIDQSPWKTRRYEAMSAWGHKNSISLT